MSEDQEMRDVIRARMKGRIRFNVATDRIEVIVGEPDELLRWEPINRLTMFQHLPPMVVERLWDMFADAAGSGFYAEDRLAGVKFIGLHKVAEYLEEEEGIRIDEIPLPSFSALAPAVSLNTYLAGRDRTTIAEVVKAVPSISEKDLPNSLKDAGWEPRRSATERFWVKRTQD
ncbi:hypothetical protein GOX01_20620 [Gluconobacter oxydans]|uniref:Uncharacterized protein n=1 Tax=Gluconobacter oxydans TaxID=442 RepID=A0AB35AQ22_GLUOY|nr:hypothetical protein [Gluconobacter oxydans]MBF0856987.1 hypothetical protein [Gluconobacter oxydans]TCW23684.1 hypothetical protein EDC20_12328 [Gluconobacter oxydans]GEC61731.1 hypothetical protein GOX01_20620 [Gluconobacter oxydans]